MLDDLLDFFVPLAIVVLVLGGATIAIVAGIDYLSCRGFSKGTGIDTRWEWGCYANVDGKWVPSEYVFGKAKELRIK